MFNPAEYPANWPELRAAVHARAGNRCEGSPAYPDCRAENGKPHPVTGSRVCCTTAHLHGTSKRSTNIDDLRFMCNRCHLYYDLSHHMAVQRANRERRRGLVVLPGMEVN